MKTTCYLTLEPTFWTSLGDPRVNGFRVVKVTKKKPQTPGVVVQLVLDVPKEAFEPLRPAAEVSIDVPDVQVNVRVEPIEGEA